MSPPPRVPPPPPTQESGSMNITLTLSPFTPLNVQFNTPSLPSPLFGHFIPWNLLEAHDDELSDKELKQIEADDQAIQTILLGLPEDIYAAVDSCETAQEISLRVQQMMKGSDIGIQEKKAKLFN
nr:hypothetical protein [Tanacetum cinerariifolium]